MGHDECQPDQRLHQAALGLTLPLLNFDGAYLGKISTHGAMVNVNYGIGPL